MKLIVSCLALTLALPLATSAQTSAERELATLSLRPSIGAVPVGFSYGGAALVRLSGTVGATLAAKGWRFASGCPDIVPSTCGDDGRSLTAGVRLEVPSTHPWSPFLEGHVGRYWFSEMARDGDRTLALGLRPGIVWFTASGIELEAAIEVQRLSGYERDGVAFPVKGIGGLQFAVGLPIF